MKEYGFPLLSPFKPYIWDEFNRRLTDFGLYYPQSTGDRLTQLKGPRNTWIRMHSFAQVKIQGRTYKGLTLRSGFGFDDTYGTLQGRGARLGLDADSNWLESPSFERYRPGPGITGVTVDYAGDFGSVKRATINWTCHSLEQLELLNYFFMTPGTTVLIEYGWGNIPSSYGFDLKDLGRAAKYSETTGDLIEGGSGILGAWTNREIIEEKISAVNGNYDAVLGMIADYNWTSNGKEFNCTTRVSTIGETLVALSQRERNVSNNTEKQGPDTFEQYILNYIDRIRLGELDGDPGVWRDRNVVTRDQNQDGEAAIRVEPTQRDYIFITWGFLEALIKAFFTQKVQGTDVDLFQLDSSDVLISSHPNLISTDGKVMIIPDPSAPKYTVDAGLAGRENHSINGLNFHDGSDRMSGRLHNLFINIEAIEYSLKKQPIKGFLYDLLAKITQAGCNLWNFQIRSKANRENVMEVVDLNFTGERATEDFLNRATDDVTRKPKSDTDAVPFLFRVDSANSIVRDFSLDTSLTSDQVANIVLSRMMRGGYAADATQMIGLPKDVITDLYIGQTIMAEYMGDLVNFRAIDPQKNRSAEPQPDDNNTEEYDSLKYWKIWDETQNKFIRYVYPHKEVVNAYLYENRGIRDSKFNNRNNNLLINIKASVTVDGVAGIRPGDVFMIDVAPATYRDRGVFQVVDVAQQLDGADWVTRIDGQFRIANLRTKNRNISSNAQIGGAGIAGIV